PVFPTSGVNSNNLMTFAGVHNDSATECSLAIRNAFQTVWNANEFAPQLLYVPAGGYLLSNSIIPSITSGTTSKGFWLCGPGITHTIGSNNAATFILSNNIALNQKPGN